MRIFTQLFFAAVILMLGISTLYGDCMDNAIEILEVSNREMIPMQTRVSAFTQMSQEDFNKLADDIVLTFFSEEMQGLSLFEKSNEELLEAITNRIFSDPGNPDYSFFASLAKKAGRKILKKELVNFLLNKGVYTHTRQMIEDGVTRFESLANYMSSFENISHLNILHSEDFYVILRSLLLNKTPQEMLKLPSYSIFTMLSKLPYQLFDRFFKKDAYSQKLVMVLFSLARDVFELDQRNFYVQAHQILGSKAFLSILEQVIRDHDSYERGHFFSKLHKSTFQYLLDSFEPHDVISLLLIPDRNGVNSVASDLDNEDYVNIMLYLKQFPDFDFYSIVEKTIHQNPSLLRFKNVGSAFEHFLHDEKNLSEVMDVIARRSLVAAFSGLYPFIKNVEGLSMDLGLFLHKKMSIKNPETKKSLYNSGIFSYYVRYNRIDLLEKLSPVSYLARRTLQKIKSGYTGYDGIVVF